MNKFSRVLVWVCLSNIFWINTLTVQASDMEFKLELTQIGTDYAELNLSLPELMKEVEIFRSPDNVHFCSVKAFVDSNNHYMIIDPFDQSIQSSVFYKVDCVNLNGKPFSQKFSFTLKKGNIHFSLKNTNLSIHRSHSDHQNVISFYIFNEHNVMIYEGAFKEQCNVDLPMLKPTNETWYIYYSMEAENGLQRISGAK